MSFDGGTLLCLIGVYVAYRVACWLSDRKTTNHEIGRRDA